MNDVVEVPVVEPPGEVDEEAMKISQTSNPSMTWPPPFSVETDGRIYDKGRFVEIMRKNRQRKVLRKRQKLLKQQKKHLRRR